jgi:hypothetical protein
MTLFVVLPGQADRRDSILTPAERSANRMMMICVSRAVKGCARVFP